MIAAEKILDHDRLEEAADMLKIVAHPVRLEIIELLNRSFRLSVTDIYTTLGIEQTHTSHHLALMREAGMLGAEREGKNIYYFLKLKDLMKVISCISECCNKRIKQ